MDATRIVVLRHGETAWNVDTRIQGQLDIGLNARGRWQAEQAARALAAEPFARIYASDLARARDTADAIGRAGGHDVVTHDGLRERGFGRFEGHTFAEIEQQWPEDALRWRKRDPWFAPAEGGEHLVGFRERVVATAHDLASRHVGEQIAIVAHGGVLDILYRAATGQELDAPRTWALANASINRLLWTPGGLTLVGWGDVRHLESPGDGPRDERTA